MTESLDVTPKTTEHNLIVRIHKSLAEVTNNRCGYVLIIDWLCTAEAREVFLSWVSKVRGAVGAEGGGGGAWGGGVSVPTGEGFGVGAMLVTKLRSLVHFGCYILQFRCPLYTRNPPIYRYVHLVWKKFLVVPKVG